MKTFWLTGKTNECIKNGQQAKNINFIEDASGIEFVSQETQTKNEKFDLIHDIQLQDHQQQHHQRQRLHLQLRRL